MTPPARRTQPARKVTSCRKLSCAGHFTHITDGLSPLPEQDCSAISEKRMKAPKTQMSKSMPLQGLGPGEMATRWVIGKNMFRVPTHTKGLPDFQVSGIWNGILKNETSNARPPPKPLHLTIGIRKHDTASGVEAYSLPWGAQAFASKVPSTGNKHHFTWLTTVPSPGVH